VRRHRDPRVGVFELAMRSGDRAAAEQVLAVRHEYWISTQSQTDHEESENTKHVGANAILFAEVPFYIGITLGMLGFAAVAAFLNVILLLLVFPIALGWGISKLTTRARNVRTKFDSVNGAGLFKIIAEGRCIDCQYDITGCNDEFEIGSSVALGPRRCPECGTFWPRVPGPTPDEMHRWHQSWFIRR
jgi:hypothetical protein